MRNNIKKYMDKHFNSLENKVVFISGGTGEIGLSIIQELVYLKAKVILGARDLAKGLEVQQKYNVELIHLDLNDMMSIISCVKELKKYNIDFAIHNAGISNPIKVYKEFKIESNFMVNCYGPYYMIRELKNVTHIIVGSISYRKNNDLYSSSKRSLLQIAYIFNKEGYDIRVTHPGIVNTKLFKKRNKGLLVNLIKPFMNDSYKSGLSIMSGIYIKPELDKWIGPRGLFESFGYHKVKALSKRLFSEIELGAIKNSIININMIMEEKYGI